MSLNDQLAALFKANPGVWLDGRKLAEVAGAYAWRSRVSDLRRHRGMTIENRERRIPILHNPDNCFTVSEYRYLPPVEPEQLPLIERETLDSRGTINVVRGRDVVASESAPGHFGTGGAYHG